MKIFSFFAGVGMLDLGFQDAGYEVVFVNEFKEDFLKKDCLAKFKGMVGIVMIYSCGIK